MKLISAPALAAMTAGAAIVSGAVAIFCSPVVRVFGGYGALEIEGEQYAGLGDRAMAQVTGGAVGGSEQNITLTLSGIDPEAMALFEADELKGASAVVYRMIFDGSGTEMLDVRPYKRGRIDDVPIDEVIGGPSTITAEVESAARGLGRNGGRMRSDADQRLIDPLDGFFKHTSYAGEKSIYFGGKISSAAKSGV